MSKISIIIPVYNAEKYLRYCIDSIRRQSYRDYEIVLVDDGSRDSSGEICDEYAAEEENIFVIHTQNNGPAAARHTGLNSADGKYIMFVDADDWLDGDMLSLMIGEEDKSDADIVCLGHKEVDGQGKVLTCSSQEIERLEMTEHGQMMYHLHGTRLIDSGPWAKLIKRTLFEGVDFCENVTIGEDYFMVLQLLEKADKAVFLREPMYNRCIRTTSISRSGYSERHRHAFQQYMSWRIYLVEKYPELKTEIVSYHAEYEMAVITAMCRNKKYDWPVIEQLKMDLQKNYRTVLHCHKTPLYMQISAVMIAYCTLLFILIFRMIHILTGR